MELPDQPSGSDWEGALATRDMLSPLVPIVLYGDVSIRGDIKCD